MMKFISLLLCVFILFDPIISTLSRHHGVIWRESRTKLTKGAKLYRYVVKLESPCNLFKQNSSTFDHTLLFDFCESAFNEFILIKLEEVHHKVKRSVPYVPLGAVGAAAFIGSPIGWILAGTLIVISVGVGIYSVIRTFSNSREITKNGLTIEELKRQNLEFSKAFNQLEDKHNLLAEDFVKFKHQITLAIGRSTTITSRFAHLGSRMSQALDEWNGGIVTKSLFESFKIPFICEDCPVDLIEPKELTKIAPNVIEIIFLAKILDRSSKLMEAHPFTVVNTNSTHYCKLIYNGPSIIVH